MTSRNAVRVVALAAASALTASIVLMAPTVGSGVFLVLVGAWTALAIVRIVWAIELTRDLYGKVVAASLSR